MVDIKAIEAKIREKLKTTESVPLIYTDPADDVKTYHGAEAYYVQVYDKVIVSIAGSDIEYTLDWMINGYGSEIYMADLGEKLT